MITSLPDDAALRAVMLGPTGLIGAMAPEAVLIETSTVSAEASAEVDAAAQARGIAYLRAPVSGNASIVHTGALSCFVSGPKDAFESAKPLFASFTRAQTYLGPGEEARYAKLAVNLMIAVSAAMMAESLALARKGGIDWQDILKVLDESAVASPMVKYKTAPLRSRDFVSSFSCKQMAKDLDLILGAGHAVGVPLQLAAQVRETYGSLVAQGDGETDFIATVKHLERLSGPWRAQTLIDGGTNCVISARPPSPTRCSSGSRVRPIPASSRSAKRWCATSTPSCARSGRPRRNGNTASTS